MAFFGVGKKSILEKALTSAWRTPEEKEQLLAQLREAGVRAIEAIPILWHSDPAVRQVAVELFLARPDAAALHELVARMMEQPPHVRPFVTRLFVKIPAEIAGKVVDELLADKAAQQRRLGWEVALWVSADLRPRYLERAVREAPAAARVPALQRLLQDRPPAELVDLLLGLARDPEPRVAAIALENVAKVQDPRVLDLMMDRLQAGEATSRDVARAWLHEAARTDPRTMRKRMMELLSAGDDATRHACVGLLLATGAPEDVLIDVLLICRDLVGWLRTRILETLRTFGDPILLPALALLTHPEEEVRTAALVLAENFQDPRLVEPICRLLVDPDWWLRITACDILARLKDERAVPHLVKALEDEDCRWAAIDALAQIGSPLALKPLAGIVRDPRPEVRQEIVRAFSRFTDQRLLPLLAAVKERDPSSEVRTRAAEVMRDMEVRLHLSPSDTEKGTSAGGARLTRPLDRLLAQIRDQGASDLHFTVDEPPFARRGGVLERMGGLGALGPATTREAILSLLTDKQRAVLEQTGELDFCHAIPEVGRYRVNAFHQRRGWCATFRVIPNVPPTFADLRLPGRLSELLDYHQGIIIVSGPAGSGKSTTLAAIVNLINETKPDHVITLEDPIEFVHPVKSALVNQREVGSHTNSFARALRAALREDPDVIVVGEMRDTETIRLALTAAETGHLVIGTLHTTSAIGTVDRLVKSFPPEEQPQVRMGLSESLKYVVSQSLLPRKDGKGRVAVYEVLKGTLPVGNLIRDNKTYQLGSMMQIGRSVGMQTVDVALAELVEAGLISAEAAWRRAEKPETFEAACDPSFLRERGVQA
jgi:twitching motility protein PilT